MAGQGESPAREDYQSCLNAQAARRQVVLTCVLSVYVWTRVLRSGGGVEEWADAIAKATHYTHNYKVPHTHIHRNANMNTVNAKAMGKPKHDLRHHGRIVHKPYSACSSRWRRGHGVLPLSHVLPLPLSPRHPPPVHFA